ncbi:MAG: guanylate kinase [Elusimicrobiaceae bacterium]|nr:guanylate kinase [Elusimicrobiaceae bacterium]
MKPFPIIISSPSGGGKTTVVERLLKKEKNLSRVVTATTRAPRTGEKNGKDYHFWTEKQFLSAVKKGQMLEWAQVHVNYYGIPKKSVDDLMKKGICPVLVIDVQGAKTIAAKYPQAVKIFILPPSLQVLKERIAARKDNTQNIEVRLKTAKKELKEIAHYDYVVLNDDLKKAVADTSAIVRAEQLKTQRCLKDLKQSKVI